MTLHNIYMLYIKLKTCAKNIKLSNADSLKCMSSLKLL